MPIGLIAVATIGVVIVCILVLVLRGSVRTK
jgi:hypothetical protein